MVIAEFVPKLFKAKPIIFLLQTSSTVQLVEESWQTKEQ